MDPLETLAKLRESMPRVRQFLADSIQRSGDPELQSRIARVVATLDENFAVVDQELPAYLDDLNARKATAEQSIHDGIVQMQKVQTDLTDQIRAEQARTRALQAERVAPP